MALSGEVKIDKKHYSAAQANTILNADGSHPRGMFGQ